DMSSLDLFPSTLVVLARSLSGLFFACSLSLVSSKINGIHTSRTLYPRALPRVDLVSNPA
ncbi:MAG: hypothetical protein AAGJ30_09485, partial [Pseudomonadota bacterium]